MCANNQIVMKLKDTEENFHVNNNRLCAKLCNLINITYLNINFHSVSSCSWCQSQGIDSKEQYVNAIFKYSFGKFSKFKNVFDSFTEQTETGIKDLLSNKGSLKKKILCVALEEV